MRCHRPLPYRFPSSPRRHFAAKASAFAALSTSPAAAALCRRAGSEISDLRSRKCAACTEQQAAWELQGSSRCLSSRHFGATSRHGTGLLRHFCEDSRSRPGNRRLISAIGESPDLNSRYLLRAWGRLEQAARIGHAAMPQVVGNLRQIGGRVVGHIDPCSRSLLFEKVYGHRA